METNKVTQYACGILFEKSFAILDKWGSIADGVLYKSKLFPNNYFPTFESTNIQGRLSNSDAGHSLFLNSDNLIYTHVIQPEESFKSSYSSFVERIVKHLIPMVIESNSLFVRRIGVVFSSTMNEKEFDSLIGKFFLPNVSGITSFRIAKKETTPSGAIYVGHDDFVNKISSVVKSDNTKIDFSFDYQLHFLPSKTTGLVKVAKYVLEQGRDSFEKGLFGGK